METKPPHPELDNPIRAPFLTLALSRRLITVMGWCIAGLVLVTIILAVSFSVSINRRPWILQSTGNGYEEVGVGRYKMQRKDVERYLNFVIPNLYGSVNGSGPGLSQIRGMINENIIAEQKTALKDKETYLKDNGISQFAIVTGINQETMVIDRDKNIAYAEVLGTIVLSRENKSQKTEVQWRCLMYIVEPTDKSSSSVPGGKLIGNKMGLFLQQIAEQAPGTINKDSPQPTARDAQERQEYETIKGSK
jgi:hypothetical protein